MKKLTSLIWLFCLLACVSPAAAQLVTATITVTNTPADGDTLVLDGVTRTFKTSVTSASTQITIGAGANATATNLYQQVAVNPIPSSIWIFQNTNQVVLKAVNATATFTGTWGTVVLTTNGLNNGSVLTLPVTNLPAASATNLVSLLVQALDAYSTNLFSTNSPALSNFVGTITVQVVLGKKTFTGANIYSNSAQLFSGGVATNVTISNSPDISGFVYALTNGGWLNPSLTNGVNFGAPFRSPGSGTGSEQLGLSASADGNDAIAIGDFAESGEPAAIAIGGNANANGASSISIGDHASASGDFSIGLGAYSFVNGNDSYSVALGAGDGNTVSGASVTASNCVAVGTQSAASATNATALGYTSTAGFANSTAVGQNSATTKTNQVALGVTSGSVWIPGALQVDGGVSNLTVLGNLTTSAKTTNTVNGIVTLNRYPNASLANGNNAGVSVGTNVYVKVSGPSSSFNINGIAGGIDGRLIILENLTAQTMVIANNSGTDPTAANRILTGTGADVSITSNPGCAMLIYDGAASNWILLNHN